jgi:hypothetical protein
MDENYQNGETIHLLILLKPFCTASSLDDLESTLQAECNFSSSFHLFNRVFLFLIIVFHLLFHSYNSYGRYDMRYGNYDMLRVSMMHVCISLLLL